MYTDDRDWLDGYLTNVDKNICRPLQAAGERFPSADRLLARFTRIRSHFLNSGTADLRPIREVHNELAVAHQILASSAEPVCTRLEYEPPLQTCAQRIDFHVLLSDGMRFFAEVKTIQPDFINRWDSYRSTVAREHFPDNVHVHHEERWLGGGLWHFSTAARAKMLAYAIEFEQRIRSCLAEHQGGTVLVFCGDGFRWDQDELEDFVAFYGSGHHRLDDPFSKMELHYLQERSLQLGRTIDHFAHLERSDHDVLPRRFTWSVKPPPEPWLHDQSLRMT